MPHPSEPRSLVLHLVGLKGVASAGPLAQAAGMSVGEVDEVIGELVASGLVEHREGALPGWGLTPVGRKQRLIGLAEELDTAGARPAVEDDYRRFLELNPQLLALCAAWQLRPADVAAGMATADYRRKWHEVANDHTDADYDAEVIEHLARVHRQVQPVLVDLEAALARFAGYRPRLASALERVVAGEGDWFTRPTLDSYHSVWFELHQDMLDTLGLDRGVAAGGEG